MIKIAFYIKKINKKQMNFFTIICFFCVIKKKLINNYQKMCYNKSLERNTFV